MTLTSGINAKAAVTFATGQTGEVGGGFTPLGQGNLNAKVTGSGNAGVTGEAGYSSTNQTSLTYNAKYTLTVKPPREFHKGFDILQSYTGRTYTLRQRTCWLALCGPWRTTPWTCRPVSSSATGAWGGACAAEPPAVTAGAGVVVFDHGAGTTRSGPLSRTARHVHAVPAYRGRAVRGQV